MEEQMKNNRYTSFSASKFLGAKEIIKSMPDFYNKVYFSSKFSSILQSKDDDKTFENITLFADIKDAGILRQIIKNNFLYVSEWDSLNYTEGKDYGFAFLAANILFILMFFEKTSDGYTIYSYDALKGNCFTTKIENKKSNFLYTITNFQGETINICDFRIECMNKKNTKRFLAPKKNSDVMESNSGFIKTNAIAMILILILCILAIIFATIIIKSQ